METRLSNQKEEDSSWHYHHFGACAMHLLYYKVNLRNWLALLKLLP
jgi:hypothetical protein